MREDTDTFVTSKSSRPTFSTRREYLTGMRGVRDNLAILETCDPTSAEVYVWR